MKKAYSILLIILFVFNFQAFSQMRKANKHYELFQYAEAIPYYLKCVESKKPAEKNLAVQRLADCYRLTSNFAEAKNWYGKTVEIEGVDPVNYFYLGQTLRSLGLYDKAVEAFNTFNTLHPDSLNGEQYYRFCIDIQPWLNLPNMAEIKNVEALNTEFSEFGPAFYKNGLVFTSDRRIDALDKSVYGWTNFGFLDLYFSEPEYADSFWGAMKKPSSMSGRFNQFYHDGPVTFNSDFSHIFITRTTTSGAKKDSKNIKTYLLKIFSANIEKNGNIGQYAAFPFNSDQYSLAHPTLSKNNNQIIFSSDMPGGFGGSDLYISSFVNGNWTKPVNLGDKINTSGNEVFPYWASDTVLFFSSTGHLGYGGLDIFQTVFTGGAWTEPENLKLPVNSSYDDFGIVLNNNLDGGFFSSNRPEGKGADDIYAFRDLKHSNEKRTVPVVTEVSGKIKIRGYVKQQGAETALEDATVFVLETGKTEVTILKTDKNGAFETVVDYDQPFILKAMKDGFIYDCKLFRSPTDTEVKTFDIPQDLLLAKLEVDQFFTVQNIYYDLGKWNIREDAYQALDNLVQIMKQYPIKAELSSHTDSRASADYNMELSQKRAESAVRYIILQGVDPGRITAKGYGETKLVNGCADGIPCTEEQHQANRRTEFKITEVQKQLIDKEQFKPGVFKNGDIIQLNMLEIGFFDNCLSSSGRGN